MLVRLGMKVCLEEYDDQISVVETFSSGEEAEKYFCEKTADVLITDIRLTGESGLELIEKVRLSHTNMLILVLSCYEDFSYARKAMELGVDKYMLKHELSDDDLPKEVMKLVAGRKKVSYTSEVEKNKEEKGISGEFAEDNLFSMGYLILRGESDISNAGRNQVDLKLLAEIVQKILNIFSLGECYLRREEEIFLIFSFDRKFSQEERRKRVTDFYENLRQNIRNYFDRNLYLVLSDEFQDPSEVRPTFEQLKMDAASVFYFDDSVLLFQENIQKKSRECPKFSLEKQQGLDSMWFQKEKKHLNSFFQEAKRNLAKPQELKILIVKYFCDLEYVLKTDYGSDFLEKILQKRYFRII